MGFIRGRSTSWNAIALTTLLFSKRFICYGNKLPEVLNMFLALERGLIKPIFGVVVTMFFCKRSLLLAAFQYLLFHLFLSSSSALFCWINLLLSRNSFERFLRSLLLPLWLFPSTRSGADDSGSDFSLLRRSVVHFFHFFLMARCSRLVISFIFFLARDLSFSLALYAASRWESSFRRSL